MFLRAHKRKALFFLPKSIPNVIMPPNTINAIKYYYPQNR